MSALVSTLGRVGFRLPRVTWRRLLDRLAAYDALHRERAGLALMDDRILRDVGMTRADVETALSRPDAHIRLILDRRAH